MKADRLDVMPIASTYGDAATHPSSIDLAAAAPGTEIEAMRIPVGAELYGVTLVNDALGASSTLQVGVKYPYGGGTDDPDQFLPSGGSASAGVRTNYFHPIRFENEAVLTATTGGAATTGKVTVIPHYRYLGTK